MFEEDFVRLEQRFLPLGAEQVGTFERVDLQVEGTPGWGGRVQGGMEGRGVRRAGFLLLGFFAILTILIFLLRTLVLQLLTQLRHLHSAIYIFSICVCGWVGVKGRFQSEQITQFV